MISNGEVMHEVRWNNRLNYLGFMKIITILEFFGMLLGITLTYMMSQLDWRYRYTLIGFVVLRLITAHINTRYVARAINAEDQYILYPFF
jgi:hypothetical protein